jgi:RNA polymerase sigma factor (TIGR02999 family)
MRRILTDHGRAHRAKKIDGFSNAVPLDQGVERKSPVESSEIDDLNDAVDRLAKINPMAAKVVEMQYFAGLTQEEIAHLLGVSSRTVKRKWAFAQAWLKQEMTQ